MLVAGVDENGLGPGLGPLVVTAVAIEVPGGSRPVLDLERLALPANIADSKQVFRRTVSSYALGEAAALALMPQPRGAGLTLAAVLARLTREVWDLGPGCEASTSMHVSALELPLWGGEPAALVEALAAARIRVVDVACRVLVPSAFNSANVIPGGKLALDYRLFEEALALLEPRPALALMGKIGGTHYYTPWLEASRRMWGVIALRESPAESRYRVLFDGEPTELRFVRDGDARYLPIAAASLIGKYVREAMMLCLNRTLGFHDALPYASGYWHDPKTREAIARFDERFADQVPRSAFLRNG